jgi:hypothetical protein
MFAATFAPPAPTAMILPNLLGPSLSAGGAPPIMKTLPYIPGQPAPPIITLPAIPTPGQETITPLSFPAPDKRDPKLPTPPAVACPVPPPPKVKNPKPWDPKVPVATFTDKLGNKLVIYCDGSSFYGELILGNGTKLPVRFGKCLPKGGINYWSFEYNADGSIKSINWYNIGPIPRSAFANSIIEKLDRMVKKLKRGSTAQQDKDGVMTVLIREKDSLAVPDENDVDYEDYKKHAKDGYITLKTVLYEFNGTTGAMTVYRLYVNIKTGKLVWLEDKTTAVGNPKDE